MPACAGPVGGAGPSAPVHPDEEVPPEPQPPGQHQEPCRPESQHRAQGGAEGGRRAPAPGGCLQDQGAGDHGDIARQDEGPRGHRQASSTAAAGQATKAAARAAWESRAALASELSVGCSSRGCWAQAISWTVASNPASANHGRTRRAVATGRRGRLALVPASIATAPAPTTATAAPAENGVRPTTHHAKAVTMIAAATPAATRRAPF